MVPPSSPASNSSGDKFSIGIIQMSCTADAQANLDKLVAQIREAAKRGAHVICTQELFRSQYFCQLEDTRIFDLAEEIPGPSTEVLNRLARELGVVIVASLFERRAAGIYHNTAAVLRTGRCWAFIAKCIFPMIRCITKNIISRRGIWGFKTFATKFGRIGVLICWDQWYPEAARLTAMQDCAVIFYPTAIGWHPSEKASFGEAQCSAWETIQRSHAIANGVYVASPNRVGLEKIPGGGSEGIEFFGSSLHCRSVWADSAEGVARPRGNTDRGSGSTVAGGDAAQLAVPARPADRRVRRRSRSDF